MTLKEILNKCICLTILALFFINSVVPADFARAQAVVATPSLFVSLSAPYSPVIVRGLSVYPENPFKFDFIIHSGDDNVAGDAFKKESEKLIKYFLAALTVPEKELWVNLSPYEKNRVIPDGLGNTQMGVDMLAQDYLLKRISASLTYPESNLGKEFWNRVYQQSYRKFGTTQIPLNTFNKVWIAPDRAVVYEKGNHVFIAERHLKVMLEEDYLALEKNNGSLPLVGRVREGGITPPPSLPHRGGGIEAISSNIVRSIILPELEREVNTGKNFANLRQIYNSLILATWYKKKIKDSILAFAYANQNKTIGINIKDPLIKEGIYQQYIKAFKKGVYNFIQDDIDPVSGQSTPRKYFSGGLTAGAANVRDLVDLTTPAMLTRQMEDFILHPASSGEDLKVTWQAVNQKIDTQAAMSTAQILDRSTVYPTDKPAINPVTKALAAEFPDLEPAERRAGEIPLFIDISEDLSKVTYYEVLDDSKVYDPDGSIHYDVLNESNGSLKKIAEFPSSYLVSPRKWMLEHYKNTSTGNLIDKLWSQGRRYTRYQGVTTSWDIRVDKDVWSTNIDTVYMHQQLNQLGVLSLDQAKVNKVTEIGVGGGHLSSLLAKVYPNAEQSITDISAYALKDTLLNILANHPKGAEALEHVRKYWGKGILALDNNQNLIFVNPPYIPAAPFEKGEANDPYRGTGLIREIIKEGYKKLDPKDPEASIYINISSLADRDLKKYLAEFGGNIEFEAVGTPLKVPLKIRWISDEWKQWLLKENGGLERIENPASDQEEYWHTLQMYRIRRKVEVAKPKRVAIIGGTFDPFHIAHRKMVEDVKDELGVDEVVVVPAYVSPHKLNTFSASAELRYEMAKAALAGMEGVTVSDFDVKRQSTSFAIDTVNHIRSQYMEGSKFFYVIGDDNVEKLDTWKDILELNKKVEFVGYTRPGHANSNPNVKNIRRIERPAIDISATIIRERVALGFPINGFVLPEVERIIHDNNLYLPEEVFGADNKKPISSLNGKPFKEDKPFALVADAHGTLLESHWKKEYAKAYEALTGKPFERGLQWVEDNIVREMIDTTRDVPFDEIVTKMARELAFNNIRKSRDEIIRVIKEMRSLYWKPEMAQARAGAIEALREMKKMGIPIRIVSGTKDTHLVYQQLQHAGFGDLIKEEEVYARDRQEALFLPDETRLTPRERTIKGIMDELPGHNLLLMDDWIQGAQVAQNLNGTFIALPQGSGLEQKRNSNRLKAEGAAMEIMDERGFQRLVSLIKVLDARREERLRNMETKNVRIAMSQFNPTVGDLIGNTKAIMGLIQTAKSKDVDVLVLPELAVTGYLPGDLLTNRQFVDQNKQMVRELAKHSKGITTIVGFVDINQYGQIYNALAVLSDGEVKGIYRKRALPNYGTFMEKRYFITGELGLFDMEGNALNKDVFNIDGLIFGVNDCEDIWVEKDGYKTIDGRVVQQPVDHHVVAPYKEQADKGARLIINASASPFREGVLQVRDELLIKRAKETGATIVYTNTVGGQDEVVFDGNSFIVSPEGKIITRGKAFEEQLIITDLPVKTEKHTEKELAATISLNKTIADDKKSVIAAEPVVKDYRAIELKYKAAILGIQDYARKNGFKTGIFGNSGGIDSGVVGYLMTKALGKENVFSMSLPTRFNSEGTKSDARRLAEMLGIHFEEVPIEDVFNKILEALKPTRWISRFTPKSVKKFLSEKLKLSLFSESVVSKALQVAIENLQPRIRMLYLMFRSNADGHLLFGTGNKSEIAVGYMTLYGDMAGGFDPIKDFYKTEVFELARYINEVEGKEIIPVSMIGRAPSAELRENQKDTDSLPDYVTQLDPILRKMIDDSLADNEIAKQTGLPIEMVIRVRKLVDGADFKRRQAQIGPKMTRVAFGHYERRMPLTKRWNAQATEGYLQSLAAVNNAMRTTLEPIRRVPGKHEFEIYSNKGPIRLQISNYPDQELHTVLLNPEIVKGAEVRLVHSIDSPAEILQAILIMDHLRQYHVGKIELVLSGHKFVGLYEGKQSADSYLVTAFSKFADKISFIEENRHVKDINNIKPFPQFEKKALPLRIDRLLYLKDQFEVSADETVHMLSNKATAEKIRVEASNGFRNVGLPKGLRGQNVVVYHLTQSSDDIINLVLTLIALREQGVNSISLVNSYLGYARQDRKFNDGDSVAAATVLKMINGLVDHQYVINAHYGKHTGDVELNGDKATSIYNLNGFVPTAEFMFNRIVAKITGIEKPEELAWDRAKALAPQIKAEFEKHPILIVGPDKGSKIYSQEAAMELKRLVKIAYGIDITVHVGYLPKKRDAKTNQIIRDENPQVLDIETDQPINQLGNISLKDAWAFVLDDMTDTGGTLLSATYILVKKLGLQWSRILAGVVHGVLSKQLLPFQTGLSDDQIKNAINETLPQQQFIDDHKRLMPPVMLTSMQTLVLPEETSNFKQVSTATLVGYIIRRIIGAGAKPKMTKALAELIADDTVPSWERPAQGYVDFLNQFAANHHYPIRNIANPPNHTDQEVKRRSKSLQNPNGIAGHDLDEQGIARDELNRRRMEAQRQILRFYPDTVFEDGRAKNNLETGMTGRGKLYMDGPLNGAEDPVAFSIDKDGDLVTAIIDRGDGTGSGFSGGFVLAGQEKLVGNTATREAIEETLEDSDYAIDYREGKLVYDGRAYSSRDTNNAWVMTRAIAVLISWKKAQLLKLKAGDDAKKDSARWVKVNRQLLSQLVDAHAEILKSAVKAYLNGELQVRDDLVKPKKSLLDEVTNEGLRNAAMKTDAVTDPNTVTDAFKKPMDTSFLTQPLTPAQLQAMTLQLKRLNPGYDPHKLLHMMNWKIAEYEHEHLPVIVGEMKDRQAFSTPRGMRILDMAIRMPGQGWAIPQELAQFKEVIQQAAEDQRLINPDFNEKYYAYITVDQKIVEPHQAQRRPGWHGDAFMTSETSDLYDANGNPRTDVVTDNTYVISDALSTLFLPGPFSLNGIDADNIGEVLKRFEAHSKGHVPLRYAPYQLVRMTPYDLHTPDFNNSNRRITRTFIKIQFSRDRLNREGNALNPLLNYDSWYWVPRGKERNNRNSIVGWNRPDKDKFLLINPNEIDFNQDTADVPWGKEDFIWGIKTGGVKREPVKPGEVVETVSDGHTSTVNIGQEGYSKITALIGDQYILSDKAFDLLYEEKVDANGWHAPKNRRPVKMLEITKPVRFKARWGVMQFAQPGSVLVKLADDDIYIVQREDFYASYHQTDEAGVKRISSTIQTKDELERAIKDPTHLSRYKLLLNQGGKDWKLDFQLPSKLDLNETIQQIRIVADMDETLASKGLEDGVTQENMDEIIRGLRLMKENPQRDIKFTINSANTFKQYITSRFGKKLSELARDPFIKSITNYQQVLDDVRADLKARALDPDQVRVVISRRRPIEDRFLKPLLARARLEGLEDQLAHVELLTTTGQEIIKYDAASQEFTYHQSQLMFTEKEQLAVAKILLTTYLEKLGKKLDRDFSIAIREIREAHKYYDVETSVGIDRGVGRIFENALAGINVRVLPFNGEIGIVFYDEQSKVDGKGMAISTQNQLRQQGLIQLHRPYFIDGDSIKGIKVSLFSKGVETKRLVGPGENVVGLGDSLIDTFLTDPPTAKTLPVYLGARADMKDQPGVIIALDQEGRDNLKERGSAGLLKDLFDVMQAGGTWADFKFVNGLFSVNELRALLPNKAMKPVGGINFDPAMMNLKVKNEGNGFVPTLSVKNMSMINISGIVPVIINIQPMSDLRGYLGLNDTPQAHQASSQA